MQVETLKKQGKFHLTCIYVQVTYWPQISSPGATLTCNGTSCNKVTVICIWYVHVVTFIMESYTCTLYFKENKCSFEYSELFRIQSQDMAS